MSVEKAIKIVKDLAEWSEKYPRSKTYHISKISMDEELIAIEERAKEYAASQLQPQATPVWVKAIERLPDKGKRVIVRHIGSTLVKSTENMGHNEGWDVGMDGFFMYHNTEWLEEDEELEKMAEKEASFHFNKDYSPDAFWACVCCFKAAIKSALQSQLSDPVKCSKG